MESGGHELFSMQEKRDWCCKNHQRGCAHTTFSPLGCDAVCVVHGESSTCKDRMQWVQENVPWHHCLRLGCHGFSMVFA